LPEPTGVSACSTRSRDRLPARTSTPTTSAGQAGLSCIAHLLSLVPYEDLTPPPNELSPRGHEQRSVRPPLNERPRGVL